LLIDRRLIFNMLERRMIDTLIAKIIIATKYTKNTKIISLCPLCPLWPINAVKKFYNADSSSIRPWME